jgi:glycosyltransferase involved in cell wall biosynthesis
MRRHYPRAQGVIAVSRGVADDVARIVRMPSARIHIVPNPVIPPELSDLATSPVDHPWFTAPGPPVILGAGGLRRSKDFPTLLRAFARLREKRALRLVILGEGRQRPRLEVLAGELGVGDDVSLPGFVANPYAYMARARLFVLSSRWEGSPNVVVEAMAVGTPVVCTDCPSGPREILQGGTYGPLVPVGDVDAMAGAMAAILDTPPSGQTLQAAVAPYTIHLSTERYLEAFGITR